MATLSSSSPSPPPLKRRRKNCARKCERRCWNVVIYFPLAFIYGLTTWAVWVEAGIGLFKISNAWTGYATSSLGILLYVLLNWSYTTAVFTDPGSTLTSSGKSGYSHLPSHEPPSHQDLPSFTVKSTGETRFCKKCQSRKPDRAHHCSTCRRCVLKMDHHCPWLATCVGLRNYKPFLLFLSYTTFFCWTCFAVTITWLFVEVLDDQYSDSLMPINYVLLCVISGIIGLVLTGFTAWHISLAWRGQTTIECLEKTRYLSPLRKSMQRQRFGHESGTTGQSYGQQLAEIHANALPGITRTEEGEERPSPTGDLEQGLAIKGGSNRNYNDLERSRERERYEDYLDEQDSEKLPNAFDLGWKRNFQHLLGEKPTLWFLPICNTSGDGWHWEPSPKWVKAREEVKRDRETQWRQQEQWDGELDQTYDERNRSWDSRDHNRRPQRDDRERHYLTPLSGAATLPKSRRRSVGTEDRMNGHSLDTYTDGRTSGDSLGSKMSMKTIRRRSSFDDASEDEEDRYEVSSDEDGRGRPLHDGGWYGQSTEVASSDGQQRDEDGWRDWD